MLRITRTNPGERPVTLLLEGRLAGPWVGELERAVTLSAEISMPIVLELAGVTFADGAGVALLRRLGERGVVLQSPSSFVATLVRRESDECA